MSVKETDWRAAKVKYHEKVLSGDALSINWIRFIDIEPLFAEWIWLQVHPFDLSQLGLGLIYGILPIDFEPFNLYQEYQAPTDEEVEQGIWVDFQKISMESLFIWMKEFPSMLQTMFKEQFQEDLMMTRPEKAIYGVTMYARGIYDPVSAREFIRATFHRLRLLRLPDISYLSSMEDVRKLLDMTEVTDKHIFDRLSLLFSAQRTTFILGLTPLGKGPLAKGENGMAEFTFINHEGAELTVKASTLDQLMFGFILGVTPLGYGYLLPKESTFSQEEGKKNPKFFELLLHKYYRFITQLPLTPWAYGNYNRPEEMLSPHQSDRAEQYHLLMTMRKHVEKWVESLIPPEESNPIKIRQYKNAILQLISWKAKVHQWGYTSWKLMDEEEFKAWWLDNWSRQGLNTDVLQRIYERSKVWLPRLRQEKERLGKRVRRRRRELALRPP